MIFGYDELPRRFTSKEVPQVSKRMASKQIKKGEPHMIVRHGDCVIERIEKLPDGLKKLERKELAYGEVTGHAHRIDVGELFETKDGQLYLRTEKFANLTHEEHKCIVLNPGVYKVTIKRQYTPEGWENVRD